MWIEVIGEFKKYENENNQKLKGKGDKKMFKKILDKLKKEWYDYREVRKERKKEEERKKLYKKLFSNMIDKY